MFKKFTASIVFCLTFIAILFIPAFAEGHEAYVLTQKEFAEGMNQVSLSAFKTLSDKQNLQTFFIITVSVLLAIIIIFFLRQSYWGRKTAKLFEFFKPIGPLAVRVAIALSFFESARTWSFLGPEIFLHSFPGALLLRAILYVISITLLFGIFTRLSALAALVIFSIAAWKYGLYVLTYLNYFGEIIVLLFFGSSRCCNIFSKVNLSGLLTSSFQKFKKYDTTIVRICYGLALCYAAINVKLLHPILTETVVKNYHLTRFHFLFPHDPVLVTLGAALAELAIGLFIIFGFELRFTVLISLFYITLSLLYFKELVWPHLLLYGISINLLVQKPEHSIDAWVDKKFSHATNA